MYTLYLCVWSSIFLNHCSLLMFLYSCGFLTSVWDDFVIVLLVLPLSFFLPSLSLSPFLSLSLYLFLVFKSIFTSDALPLPLQTYCHQFPCFGTHLLYVYKFYYVGCLSNIGFLLAFSSVGKQCVSSP